MKTPSTFALPLSPFPAARFENGGQAPASLPDGFVDDEVIASLLGEPTRLRVTSAPSDLVLSSDENDFAGWSVQPSSPFRAIAERQEILAIRPQPEAPEPGLGQPHRGGHRWWIAAATGASSALILSLLFSNLAFRANEGRQWGSLGEPLRTLQSVLGSLAP